MKEKSRELKRSKRLKTQVSILTAGIETRIGKIADKVGGAQKLANTLGVHVTQVYRYINGENQPTINIAARIAAAGQVTVDWLATGQHPSVGVSEEHPTYRSSQPGGVRGVDSGALAEVIALIEDRSNGSALPINERAELIALTYSNTISAGRLDVEFAEQLIKWLKNRGLR